MPVRKAPEIISDNITPERERAEAEVIKQAAHRSSASKPKSTGRTPVLIRVDDDMLPRIDAAAKKRGINRQNWILWRIAEALEQEGGSDA